MFDKARGQGAVASQSYTIYTFKADMELICVLFRVMNEKNEETIRRLAWHAFGRMH